MTPYNSTTAGPAALARAETKLGCPYVFGGAGPTVFDCSGLETWAYAPEGILLPHSTYLTFKIAQVHDVWKAGDLGFTRGSDPGPQGEPGHTGIFVGFGHITDYSGPRHHFAPDPHGQAVFLNAPFTGDVGGVRYDYFDLATVLFHTRPENLLPTPPPAPSLPKAAGHPTAAQIAQCSLVGLTDPAEAQEALRNGWALWYWASTRFYPQVGGKPTGVTLYANLSYKHKRTDDIL